jgi:hypothetical protein
MCKHFSHSFTNMPHSQADRTLKYGANSTPNSYIRPHNIPTGYSLDQQGAGRPTSFPATMHGTSYTGGNARHTASSSNYQDILPFERPKLASTATSNQVPVHSREHGRESPPSYHKQAAVRWSKLREDTCDLRVKFW